jgi:ribosomal protein S18 acetylase RimI-like enzyme
VARGALEREDVTVLVASLDGLIVGFAKLSFADKPWGLACEIETLVVERHTRGHGCGTRLMRAAESCATRAGAKGMRVDVLLANEPARSFYEGLGYEPFALRYGKAVADD